MSEPRLFLTSMSNGGNEDNIREMIAPIVEWLDGVIWVMHDAPADDAGSLYLETVKGEGKVIHRSYVQRHDFSMNETLFAGIIQDGDYVIWTDLLERPAAQFVSRIKGDVGEFMQTHGVDGIAYYGKMYVFRYNETMRYVGSPHWTLQGIQSAVEFSHIYPDERGVRLNVRPLKRPDPFGWVFHYAKYMLHPPGSNHAMLGLDKWEGDFAQNFQKREKLRLEFRQEVRRRGYPLTVDGVVDMLKKELDSTLKLYINGEKTWSDLYHYAILGDKTVVHSHELKDMKRIE